MLVTPSLILKGDLLALDLNELEARGIQGLIMDLDNTIMAPRSGVITPEMEAWLLVAKQKFKCVVLSNNKKAHYCEKAAEVVGLPVISHGKKPQLVNFKKIMAEMDLAPEHVAVIGDRPLTDIWGGERLGAYTILVNPLTMAQEHPVVKVLRAIEKSFVKKSIESPVSE